MGEVAVLHDESAYTPDALEILKLSVQQRIEQNMQVIAIQFEQPRSRMLTEHQLLEVFNQFDTLEFAFFESNENEKAKTWVKQCLLDKCNA